MTAASTAAELPEGSGSHSPHAAFAAQREVGATLVRWLALVTAVLALTAAALLWRRLDNTQQQLARQSAVAQSQAAEARERSLQAEALVRDTAAQLALTDARVREVAMQRAQIEGLVQTLSRSTNESLGIDLESTLRFAQQQAQLTGGAGPLIAALKTVAQRIDAAAQPRLTDAQRAVARDLDKLTSTQLMDTASLAARIDDLMRAVDDLPLANAPGRLLPPAFALDTVAPGEEPSHWRRILQAVIGEARGLLRVTRIDHPDAALLSPEQGFFVRENLKLLLQSARLGLFARQLEPARADLAAASALIGKYFNLSARKTEVATGQLQQLRAQANAVELPRIDESLAALAAANSALAVR
ncbi:MAG: uroporphyrinogen-III C-methyltransferase [Burkholderiaceae bacterium]